MENGIFSIKATKEKWLKILTPKEVFQWLPIVLTKVNAGDTSEKFTKWYQTNHILFVYFYILFSYILSVYNNIMNWIKV